MPDINCHDHANIQYVFSESHEEGEGNEGSRAAVTDNISRRAVDDPPPVDDAGTTT